MRIRGYCTFLCIFVFAFVLGAEDYYIEWADTLDNGPYDDATGIAVDNSGNIIVTGEAEIGGVSDFLTVKYNSNGIIIWVDTLDNGSWEYAEDVAVDNYNNIIVTGSAYNGIDGDYFTVKYDSNGNIIWADTIDNGDSESARAVAVDRSNNIIVTGNSRIGGDYDYFTVKYDANGNIIWADTLDISLWEYARGVAVDRSNNIIVTGSSDIGGDDDYFTVKYDSNGIIIWTDTIDNGSWDNANDVAVDNYNNIIVVGASFFGDDSTNYFTVMYDSNGTIIWADTIDNGSWDDARGVAVDSSGNIIVTGDSEIGIKDDYFTVMYDSSGTIIWADTIDNGDDDDAWGGVAVDNSGNFFVTGESKIFGDDDYFTVKYAPTFTDSVVLYIPIPYILFANGIDSTKVIAAVYSNAGKRILGMSDSISFSANLGSLYGNVIENSVDATYYQWYRAGIYAGIDTIWVVCPSCISCDSARTFIALMATGISDEDTEIPKIYSLLQNYPNPMNHTTTIRYGLPRETNASLKIYDNSGRIVKNLMEGKQSPGYYIIQWDGTNERGELIPSGIYFYRLITPDFKESKKLILLR